MRSEDKGKLIRADATGPSVEPPGVFRRFTELTRYEKKVSSHRRAKRRHAGLLVEHYRKQNPRLAMLASRLVSAAAKRATTYKVPFDLDVRMVFAKLKIGLCEVTDLPLDTLHEFRPNGGHRSPFTPSLDRKIPELGYTNDNTRVVCWVYNAAKGEATGEQVLQMAEALVRKSQQAGQTE